MRHLIKLWGMGAGIGAVAVIDGIIYALLVIPAEVSPEARDVFWLWVTVACVITFTAFPFIAFFPLRPLAAVLDALESGTTVDASLLKVARRRALNLPVFKSLLALSMWILPAAALGPTIYLFADQFNDVLVVRGTGLTVVSGVLASSTIFFGTEWYVRCRIVPVLFPEGDLSEVDAVTVSVPAKLFIVLITACVIPITMMTLQRVMGGYTTVAAVYVGTSFLALGIIQLLFIRSSIAAPLESLAREMQRLASGSLDAHADVVSNDSIGQLSEHFNAMVAELNRAEFVKDTFGRYVTQQVMEEILNGKLELGGERRTATILFSDIRGFTALSEQLDPAEVVKFLNDYLTIMVDVLVEHGGTIDKFIGDAIMATFGVPLSKQDDARRAVRAAVGMIERLEEWNAARRENGEPELEIGIGLHTGEVIAGNIGSTKKMEYTVIGDAVNTSSRIEQLNKKLGTKLLISEATHELAAEIVEARALQPVEVKGKAEPLRVYEVTGLR